MSEKKVKFPVKPIILLADSQVLFWKGKDGLLLDRVKNMLLQDEAADGEKERKITAAYVGASNEDKIEFYEIFLAAVAQVGIEPGDCMMIHSKPSEEEKKFLRDAEIVVLAGGDTRLGWDVMNDNGIREKIVERYHNGAVLIGISAGAVQLGTRGWVVLGDGPGEYEVFPTFQLVPYIIDVHDEEEGQWQRLNNTVLDGDEHGRGFGIPAGGGAIFHPDWSMEAIRHPLAEFSLFPDGLKTSMIFPPRLGDEIDTNNE